MPNYVNVKYKDTDKLEVKWWKKIKMIKNKKAGIVILK